MTVELDKMTAADALALLVKQRDKRGADFVYRPETVKINDDGTVWRDADQDGCEYVEKDDEGNLVPSCIVGGALVDAGMDPYTLYTVRAPGGGIPTAMQLRNTFNIPDEALKVFQVAQEDSDEGRKWGVAVARAATYVARNASRTSA